LVAFFPVSTVLFYTTDLGYAVLIVSLNVFALLNPSYLWLMHNLLRLPRPVVYVGLAAFVPAAVLYADFFGVPERHIGL
jgi:hypothetical protein